jgi:hypothetical protein
LIFCSAGSWAWGSTVWNHSVFSKNRDRLLTSEIAQDFLAALLSEPKVKRLLSHEHFRWTGRCSRRGLR